ncbi:TetR/AcrR family transcriptional regulator [Phytomonospora sp. NPDC050363]|uniref:TetR/AcrR family transcriptional regulator n=1 Tax=Phytomonospora sp. NPDC050363 TaxID=3155642 RepID=UPI0033CEEAE6
MSSTRGYHHGDLRRTILDAAAEAITESGPAGWSLRELARRAGVSHAAPAHHFGDKAGLLTALATEGFQLLADELNSVPDDFLEAGVAYVRFATGHRAHFEVMFQPALLRSDDPELQAAENRASTALEEGLRKAVPPERASGDMRLAAWSIAHGFAALWLSGAIADRVGEDAVEAARPVLRNLLRG